MFSSAEKFVGFVTEEVQGLVALGERRTRRGENFNHNINQNDESNRSGTQSHSGSGGFGSSFLSVL